MTVKYKHDGNYVDYTPSSNVSAGDVVVQNELVGVALSAITANELGSLCVEGVLAFPKDTGSSSAISVGEKCYWDASNEVATTTVGSNKLIGKCVKAAAADDSTVQIKMNQ